MLLSVFTPTNNTDYLLPLYDSLINQDSDVEWEWVILLNGGAERPSFLNKDKRVKFFEFENMGDVKIGALKKRACGQCSGDYLVEVDHDDILSLDAFAKIADIIDKENPDFIYSDFIEFKEDGGFNVYGESFGWENFEAEMDGERATAMRAFDPNPASLASIHHAPNHVRIWKKSFYDKLGGHNSDMDICDDYDLVIRSYLKGAKFCHINHPIYFYRLRGDGNNTYLKNNEKIQNVQKQISRENFQDITIEWCRREDLEMIDLGGAHNSPKGFISYDYQNADVNCDLSKGIRADYGSIGCVRAYDFLEHIPLCKDSNCEHQHGECAIGIMKEIYRVLAPNGVLLSATPSTDGRGAFQDLTHVSYWNPNSFWYFTRRQQAKYYRHNSTRFVAKDIYQIFPSSWHEQHNILYVYANLVANKGGRVAGLNEI